VCHTSCIIPRMTVHYELTVDDFREGLRLFRRKGKLTLLVVGWIVLLTGLLVVLPVMAAFSGHDMAFTFKSLFPLALFVIIACTAFWLGPHFAARRQFNTSPSSKGPIDLEVSDSGLHFRSPTTDSKMSWQNFARVLESKSMFLLFTSVQAFLVVPKRAFTAEQLNEFRARIPKGIQR
jgi:hypothetical protein